MQVKSRSSTLERLNAIYSHRSIIQNLNSWVVIFGGLIWISFFLFSFYFKSVTLIGQLYSLLKILGAEKTLNSKFDTHTHTD